MKITMHQKPLVTNGEPPIVGNTFPDFSLKNIHQEMISLKKLAKENTLISVVPDVNTRVCSLSTKIFNEKVDDFPAINFLTISTNSSTEQKNWCAAENVAKMQLLSDEQGSFGKMLGLYVPDKRIDARSVWIIDHKGKIIYRELIVEQSNEPDYATALEFIQAH
ncbi:peroxiredoxin [Liquorilactobacillus oeni]|uniref:Thioredoxin peroxidase n=1 Tax=Liquorilactobacillus oeni DSM 19972 TaxID=1423777 RepID=A0A0R1MCD5_9LACO|nr:peroxiredoxin [Liquorilactobacillus oeni]KRL05724.1 thioredoxin peroxidase [Liquorilactobacillus oeni DSM 19972]